VKVLLNQSTPEWQDWREVHVQALPEMQVAQLHPSLATCHAAMRCNKKPPLPPLQLQNLRQTPNPAFLMNLCQ
jgi:hypothetical protein